MVWKIVQIFAYTMTALLCLAPNFVSTTTILIEFEREQNEIAIEY